MTRKNSRELAELNRTVDWYEAYKPQCGMRLEINLTPVALEKLLRSKPADHHGAEFSYRGRIIVAIGSLSKPRTARRQGAAFPPSLKLF